MFNTKCGCPDCTGQSIPMSRWGGWKARKNKYGRMYGVGKGKVKPRKATQRKVR